MDQKPKLMTPFDMLVTSSSLYTLKLMLPFAPASIQRSLAIYIKFSELKATMEHFYGFLNTVPSRFRPGAVKILFKPGRTDADVTNGRSHEYDGNDADYEF